jgi:predicted ATPase
MAKLHSLKFRDSNNNIRNIKFSEAHNPNGHDTTIITGVNGSNKSCILREVVQHAVSTAIETKRETQETREELVDSLFISHQQKVISSKVFNLNHKLHIIAASGALSDRYPIKKIGGRPTQYDTPNYLYLGQRVGANLLSKRNSIQTAIFYLLDESNKERFSWSFYDKIFQTVGILPELELTFLNNRLNSAQRKIQKKSKFSLFDILNNPARDKLLLGSNYSKQDSEFMLNNFSHDVFGELHEYTFKSVNKLNVYINNEVISRELSQEALRLGLYAQIFNLADVRVTSRYSNKKFSIFDLSSGEYHFLTNILGIGFAAKNNSIILLDEPENSLHPQWQMEFMNLLFETCSFMNDGHILISTHSPLIVSSAKVDSTIIDLSKSEGALIESRNLYGASADNILMDHFGLVSTRNLNFVEKLQRAVDLFALDKTHDFEYSNLITEINGLKTNLKSDDPIIELIDTLSNGISQ